MQRFSHHSAMTANALAKAISVPPNRITSTQKDERGITGDTAIRLGTFFKTSAEFWINLQITYDLRNAEKALPARVRRSIEENRREIELKAVTLKPIDAEN
jgi:antitoxin HigA-1